MSARASAWILFGALFLQGTGANAEGPTAGAAPPVWRSFKLDTLTSRPLPVDITPGPDGAVWVTDVNLGLIRIDLAGHMRVVTLHPAFTPRHITVGPNRKFYIIGGGGVAIVDLSGHVHMYRSPSGDHPNGGAIRPGPDGAVWYAEYTHIARIDAIGNITEYPYPSNIQHYYTGIVRGSNGNIWFSDQNSNGQPIYIGEIDLATGNATDFPWPYCGPGLTLGKDGNIYALCGSAQSTIARVKPDGTVQTLANPFGEFPSPTNIAAGVDGSIWFCASGGFPDATYTLGRLDERTGHVTGYKAPDPSIHEFITITIGPDHHPWMVSYQGGFNSEVWTLKP